MPYRSQPGQLPKPPLFTREDLVTTEKKSLETKTHNVEIEERLYLKTPKGPPMSRYLKTLEDPSPEEYRNKIEYVITVSSAPKDDGASRDSCNFVISAENLKLLLTHLRSFHRLEDYFK